jgi:hypothetical protein
MAGIQNAPAPKPGSLKGPVANENLSDDAQAFLSAYEAPSAPPAGTQEMSPDAQAFAQEQGLTPDQAPAQGDFPIQEPSSFMGINTDIAQQLKDVPLRVQANLAKDPASVKLTLEKRLGTGNVKQKDGKFFIKQPGDKAFRELDPSTFEVVNDLYSDFYREYIQTMGGVAGGVAGAPLGPMGIVAGAGLGAAAATAAVDGAAESFGGVVPAEQKGVVQKTGEALMEGAAYTAGEGAGNFFAAKFAARRLRLDKIRKLEEVAPVDKLTEGVKSNLETLADLRNMGLNNTTIPANQIIPGMPEAELAALSVAKEPAFIQAQKEATESIGQTVLDLTETAAGLTKKGRLNQVIREGVPLENAVNASEINGLFNSVRKAEGAVLGDFRKMAKDTAKKTPLPSPQTSQAVKDIFESVGVKMKEGKLVFPKEDDLIQIVGSKDLVAGFKGDLIRLNNKLMKGGLTIDDMLNESQFMGAKNETARRIGGVYKNAIGKVSSALRTDSREAMPMVLKPDDALLYAEKMKRFGSISKSMDQLEGYLRDDIGMNTFAKGLVNKGKEGLANLRSAKEFLLQEKPDLYENLIGQYMEELALKHRNPGKVSGFNAEGMRKELAGLGSEYLDELFPARGGVNKNLVLRSFDLAEQVENAAIKGSDKQLEEKLKQHFGGLSYWTRGLSAVQALTKFTAKNDRILKVISREGVESFLTQVPKKNKTAMRNILNEVLTQARRAGTLAAVGPETFGLDEFLGQQNPQNSVQKGRQ